MNEFENANPDEHADRPDRSEAERAEEQRVEEARQEIREDADEVNKASTATEPGPVDPPSVSTPPHEGEVDEQQEMTETKTEETVTKTEETVE